MRSVQRLRTYRELATLRASLRKIQAMSLLRRELSHLLTKIPIDFGGGCSVRKAHVMAWLISRFQLKQSLDIGVYRGRSLLPQSLAHRLSGGGIAYGVDPW